MNNIPEESYLELKRILEKQNRTTYTMEEIKEIGDDLVELYMLLIGGEDNDPQSAVNSS